MAPERSSSVRIWVAGGSLNVPSLVRNLIQTGHDHVAAILDDDARTKIVVEQLRQALDPHGTHLIFASPDMEDWLESSCSNDYVLMVPPTSVWAKVMRRYSGHAILWEILDSNAEFARWAESALGVTADSFARAQASLKPRVKTHWS